MGKYQRIREVVREIMKDGKFYTAEQLHKRCIELGVQVSENRSEIYNVVHQLKQRGEMDSDSEKGYILLENAQMKSIYEKEIDIKMEDTNANRISKQDIALAEFEVVQPAKKKEVKQVISIFDNGDLVFNRGLSKTLENGKVEIRIKKDCSQLALVPNGNILLTINKNNHIKNYYIYEKLKKKKIKFPVYYVGEWNEDGEVWIGDLVLKNPNKSTGTVMK